MQGGRGHGVVHLPIAPHPVPGLDPHKPVPAPLLLLPCHGRARPGTLQAVFWTSLRRRVSTQGPLACPRHCASMRAWSIHARSQVMVDNGTDRLRKRTGPGGPPGLQNRSLPARAGGLGSTPRRFRHEPLLIAALPDQRSAFGRWLDPGVHGQVMRKESSASLSPGHSGVRWPPR